MDLLDVNMKTNLIREFQYIYELVSCYTPINNFLRLIPSYLCQIINVRVILQSTTLIAHKEPITSYIPYSRFGGILVLVSVDIILVIGYTPCITCHIPRIDTTIIVKIYLTWRHVKEVWNRHATIEVWNRHATIIGTSDMWSQTTHLRQACGEEPDIVQEWQRDHSLLRCEIPSVFSKGVPFVRGRQVAREKFAHPYKKCFVLLLNRCGISQSTPFRVQRFRWHSFLSPTDVGSYNPPPLQDPVSSLALIPPSNLCGISQSTLLRCPASSLAHLPMPGIDIICNSPNPPLLDIVLFELFFSGFPSRISKRVCKGEVSTLL